MNVTNSAACYLSLAVIAILILATTGVFGIGPASTVVVIANALRLLLYGG